MASYTLASRPGGTTNSRSNAASVSLAASSRALGKEIGSDHRVSVKFGGLHADGALGADNDPIHPLLRLVELSFAMPLQLSAPLIRHDRLVELDLAAFEPADDLLELGKRILETHRGDIGGNAWVDHMLYSLTKNARMVLRSSR